MSTENSDPPDDDPDRQDCSKPFEDDAEGTEGTDPPDADPERAPPPDRTSDDPERADPPADDHEDPVHTEPPEDEKVGYRNPPKHSRFRPGQSGNASGKKKGLLNLDTALENAMCRLFPAGDDSEPVSAAEAIYLKVLTLALKGNLPAARFLIKQARKLESKKGRGPKDDDSLSDEEIVRRFLSRKGQKPGPEE